MKKYILSLILLFSVLDVSAQIFFVDGINYEITSVNSVALKGGGSYVGSITIPSIVSYNDVAYAVTSIDNWAFSGCGELSSITLSDSLITIGDGAFYGCSQMTTITLPNAVTAIGQDAFRNCTGLESIQFSNSLTSIGSYAFLDCSGLISIVLPDSLKHISYSAFTNCTNLTSVILPDVVTSIGSWAFSNCNKLSSIEFPNSLLSIGTYSFDRCNNIAFLSVNSEQPPLINSTTFYAVNRTIPVYVPSQSVELYKNADGWKDFTNIIADFSTVIEEVQDLNCSISVSQRKLRLDNVAGRTILIYDISGKIMYVRTNSNRTEEFVLQNPDIYIVSIDGFKKKIVME